MNQRAKCLGVVLASWWWFLRFISVNIFYYWKVKCKCIHLILFLPLHILYFADVSSLATGCSIRSSRLQVATRLSPAIPSRRWVDTRLSLQPVVAIHNSKATESLREGVTNQVLQEPVLLAIQVHTVVVECLLQLWEPRLCQWFWSLLASCF